MSDLSEQYALEDFKEARRRLYLISIFNSLVTLVLLLSDQLFDAAQWPWIVASAAIGSGFALYARLENWRSTLRISRAAVLYVLVLIAEFWTLGLPAVFAPGYGLGSDPPVFSTFSLANAVFPYLCLGMQTAGIFPFILLYRQWASYSDIGA